MRVAHVFVSGVDAGLLEELTEGGFRFSYHPGYQGAPVSLTMPIEKQVYSYQRFPAFFEGLLPEGVMMEAMLKQCKLDRDDYFGQLIQVGQDLVGAVTVEVLP